MHRRWLFWFAVSVGSLYAVPACMSDSSDTKLNPQPLPPSAPPDESNAPGSEAENSGTGAAPPPGRGDDVGSADTSDAGDAGDAADGSDVSAPD